MLDAIRSFFKVRAFRKSKVVCTNYDTVNFVITLARSKKSSKVANLSIRLVKFDEKLQVAFSGDIISRDGKALSRVMKVMWNETLPFPEPDLDELRKQLGKPAKEPVYFRDMAMRVAGMPNEVIVTVKTSYLIDE